MEIVYIVVQILWYLTLIRIEKENVFFYEDVAQFTRKFVI